MNTKLIIMVLLIAISMLGKAQKPKIKYYNNNKNTIMGKGYVHEKRSTKMVGKWSFYYKDGSIAAVGEFLNEVVEYPICVGKWTFFWNDGTIANKYIFSSKGELESFEVINTAYENHYEYKSGNYAKGESNVW